MEWYIKVIKDNYVNFEGRARRKEYWMFNLIHIIIVFVLAFLGGFLGSSEGSIIIMIPLIIYILGTLLPTLAVTVRRLHDTGKSGWYYFFTLIPYIGSFILLIFMVIEGDTGQNKYGPDPKAPSNEEINEIGKPLE